MPTTDPDGSFVTTGVRRSKPDELAVEVHRDDDDAPVYVNVAHRTGGVYLPFMLDADEAVAFAEAVLDAAEQLVKAGPRA